ncbi:DUF2479 domain-containing protein [Pediococcus acidilactici]|uniref:BppU family phage baseplate upper protein n=1 Tax=Pediococcus acidilactici TaxID=1254 RepID=UPI0013308193|nr:BppU family phage baseplate upper protein [Pediococcus acidilactici]KAF0500065.1 DUF2479 domain-containing protein [Pediococcus acidilactici]
MSMYLKFRIGKDKRKLVPINGFELNDADSNNPQWIQGRQNEDGGRQVFVDLEDEDGSPVNLTGANAIFKGVLPGGEYKIWDHKHSTIIDAQAGRFRYTFPKRAMAIAGSYKQAFFEVYREGSKLATLEFNFEVLADLVEENIIPSDYITPFEDLYGKLKEYLVKFNGDFEAAMAQWKKDVADLITELNADVSGINLTITEIKSQLSALEDKIKADNLVTVGDLNDLLAPFNDILDTLNDYRRLNHPWIKDNSSDVLTALSNYASTVSDNENVVRILNLQDIHATKSKKAAANYVTGGNAVINQLRSLDLIKDKVDMVVVNGDNIDGGESRMLNIRRNQQVVDTIHGVMQDKPILFTMGNHDDGSVWKDGAEVITLKELTDIYDYQFYNKGEIRPDNTASYAYYDFPNQKVRAISLSGFENPEVYNEDGTIKYKRGVASVFTAKQLNWLVQALKISSDWSVIIFNHSPYEGFYNNAPYNYITNLNHNVLKDILKAFVNGTKVTSVGVNTDFPANITADFSGQGKGTLITNVFGHEHRDADKVVIDDIPAIERTCDIALTTDRVVGTSSEYAFDIIEINVLKRTIKFNRFGAGESVSWSY